MATLVFSTYTDGTTLGVEMDYTAAYDAATDKITITFGSMRFRYNGMNGYASSHSATVKVDGASGTTYSGTGTTHAAAAGTEYTASPVTASKSISFTASGTTQNITFTVVAEAWRYINNITSRQYAVNVDASLTVTFTADRGLVRIGYGGETRKAMVYVPYNGAWRRAIPYIGKDGVWKMGV